MVEAMHEQHPDFFKQHRKNFRYLVLEKEPKIGLDIPSGSYYAFGVLSFTSDYLRGFEKQPYYHVLFECGSTNRKGYIVPCLYSTFCLLLADFSSCRPARGNYEPSAGCNEVQRVRKQNLASEGSTHSSCCSNQRRQKCANWFFTDCHV